MAATNEKSLSHLLPLFSSTRLGKSQLILMSTIHPRTILNVYSLNSLFYACDLCRYDEYSFIVDKNLRQLFMRYPVWILPRIGNKTSRSVRFSWTNGHYYT
jgi:hypothetical protein